MAQAQAPVLPWHPRKALTASKDQPGQDQEGALSSKYSSNTGFPRRKSHGNLWDKQGMNSPPATPVTTELQGSECAVSGQQLHWRLGQGA